MLERSARPERAAQRPPLMPGRAGRRGEHPSTTPETTPSARGGARNKGPPAPARFQPVASDGPPPPPLSLPNGSSEGSQLPGAALTRPLLGAPVENSQEFSTSRGWAASAGRWCRAAPRPGGSLPAPGGGAPLLLARVPTCSRCGVGIRVALSVVVPRRKSAAGAIAASAPPRVGGDPKRSRPWHVCPLLWAAIALPPLYASPAGILVARTIDAPPESRSKE